MDPYFRIRIAMMVAEEERRERRASWRARMRMLRDAFDPLEIPNNVFVGSYRVSKDIFRYLCEQLTPLLNAGIRNTRISPQLKILTALHFYAHGSYQKGLGLNMMAPLSQAEVSKSVKEVTIALNGALFKQHVRFPSTRQERNVVRARFYELFHFPGVIGCVDGTHVAIVRPRDNEEQYFNRKGYHSKNVQIVCDGDLKILAICSKYGGASHDSHIWRMSAVGRYVENLHRNHGESGFLLGDSGYALRTWMMVPILDPAEGSPEETFNRFHIRTRNCVERCIGVLKARWRCLLVHRVLHYHPAMAGKIINACAVLHNIALAARLPAPEPIEEIHRQSEISRQIHVAIRESQRNGHELNAARRLRNQVMVRLVRD